MIKSGLLLLLSVLLSGCIEYVYIPVFKCPEPTYPAKMELKTKTKYTSTDEMLKAMVWDITYLDGYSEELLTILQGYKAQKKEGP